MLENLIYKYQNRNSKKNLKKQIEKLGEDLNEKFNDLRKETLGKNSMGWITFSTYSTYGIGGRETSKKSDDSLLGQINDLREFLGVDYSDAKLTPKPIKE